MTPTKTKVQQQVRQVHRVIAPILVLPLILTAVTGSLYQLFDLAHQESNVEWLLAVHKGNFGILNLSIIYPFLNAFGLIILAVTGITMWVQSQRRSRGKLIDK